MTKYRYKLISGIIITYLAVAFHLYHNEPTFRTVKDILTSISTPLRLNSTSISTPPRLNSTSSGAAICVISKWTLPYIDEWVDYHLAIGFEKIYIYDNSDEFELQEWYKERNDDRIEVNHHPGLAQQGSVYDRCGTNIKNNTAHSWIGFFDMDEFLMLRDMEKFPYIMDYLDTIPNNTSGIGVNRVWIYFNNQMKFNPEPVTLRFPRNSGTDKHVKTIVRSHLYNKYFHPHFVKYENSTFKTKDSNGNIVKGPFNRNKPSDVIVFFHYYTKSMEEFRGRCKRGRADIKLVPHREKFCTKNPDKYLLDFYGNDTIFDDSPWKLLKERVPKYKKYEFFDRNFSSGALSSVSLTNETSV